MCPGAATTSYLGFGGGGFGTPVVSYAPRPMGARCCCCEVRTIILMACGAGEKARSKNCWQASHEVPGRWKATSLAAQGVAELQQAVCCLVAEWTGQISAIREAVGTRSQLSSSEGTRSG